MAMGKISRLVFLLMPLVQGCALGHCRKNEVVGAAGSEKSETQAAVTVAQKVVFKYDESRQCNTQAPIALEVMAKELSTAGIKIFSQEKKSDNLMRIQVCGAATGKANVYTIAESDVPKALELGFKVWTFDD